MNTDATGNLYSFIRNPLSTPRQVMEEAAPFPTVTAAEPHEAFFLDWRGRLTRNLSRRSDSRWEPLTFVHGPK